MAGDKIVFRADESASEASENKNRRVSKKDRPTDKKAFHSGDSSSDPLQRPPAGPSSSAGSSSSYGAGRLPDSLAFDNLVDELLAKNKKPTAEKDLAPLPDAAPPLSAASPAAAEPHSASDAGSNFVAEDATAEYPGISAEVEGRIREARRQAKGDPVLAGGHITQTMEIPIIGNEDTQKADTQHGLYIEFAEPLQVALPDEERVELEELIQEITGAESVPEYVYHADDDSDAKQARGQPREPIPPERRRKVLNIAVIILLLVIMLPAFFAVSGYSFVTFYDDDRFTQFAVTKETDIRTLIEQSHLALESGDSYQVDRDGANCKITLLRGLPVAITADGRTFEHPTRYQTVADFLESAGVHLGEDDETNLPLEALVGADDQVIVYRVEHREREVSGPYESQQIDKPTPLLADGTSRVVNTNNRRDGEAIFNYLDKYVDGVFADSQLARVEYLTVPVHEVTLIGDGSAAMSPLDGAAFTDIEVVDNAPTAYDLVIENGSCTAYNFGAGTYGASGMYMFQGFVAVNPDVIPYGSLLYITSSDGSFVYGWAIAADTGVAMMQGIVDVDLYFETSLEPMLFGKHTMNIYVVAQLTQHQLEQYKAPYSEAAGLFDSRIPQ